MEWMMERLNHPEKTFRSIHIAGTNGKGSTLSFIRSLLQHQGFKVGTFTSPYIVRFNERISLNGEPISDEDLIELVNAIRPLAEELGTTPLGEPTEFEVITAMSMLYFSKQQPDFALYEAGLGGRYDSTNIIEPILAIITNIGKDHMSILGNTYELIAEEKAGIIKYGTPTICGAKQKEAIEVIEQKGLEMKADVSLLGRDFKVEHLESSDTGEVFIYTKDQKRMGPFTSGLKGNHQVENAALAIEAIEYLREEGFDLDPALYDLALEGTSWPARFETLQQSPLTIVDGAHNEEGTEALVETLKQRYSHKKIHLIYAALADKPVERMLELLGEVVTSVTVTTFPFPRALRAEQLKVMSPVTPINSFESYKEAIEEVQRSMGEDDVLLITGSLYFISDIRKYFENNENL
ncbi:bifunctional folylpolyglutamate synthase/dihydrofolate synthase [Halobacillus fulvus]|nr:bifunctional folylpolyglutamate synthase/dihydrofolate synthase [Halobacillus fulvus]